MQKYKKYNSRVWDCYLWINWHLIHIWCYSSITKKTRRVARKNDPTNVENNWYVRTIIYDPFLSRTFRVGTVDIYGIMFLFKWIRYSIYSCCACMKAQIISKVFKDKYIVSLANYLFKPKAIDEPRRSCRY